MLLTEFDPSKSAIINPGNEEVTGKMPKITVACFSRLTFERMAARLNAVLVDEATFACASLPMLRGEYKGLELGLALTPTGAPACVSMFESVFAMGAETVILFGTCGVLDGSISDCSIIIPTSALRDEGTSFHYAPASDEIKVNPRYTDLFTQILDEHGARYTVGKTWSTDGFFRETRKKTEDRRRAGCICVDMECSAMAALAAFREKEVFQFFYAADNLAAEEWDRRSLANDANADEKDKIALLACELARAIDSAKNTEKTVV